MAYVLSSVSGNLISAASAGFAPTNSADVSAIASSYQVVSATATQLYAGTAYVTSVNDAPLSAARAGNAANAVQATSAWYDGTGRLLSSLPDEATVSAIASAYQVVSSVGTSQNGPKSIVTGINGLFISARYADTANEARKDGSGRTISSLPDSAAVSAIASAYAAPKLDTSALEKWQTGDEPLAAYSGIGGIPIHPTGADYAHEADYADEAESASSAEYAESADYWTNASSKQDTLTFGYDSENKISSIDGSALAGGEGGGTTYVSPSGTVWISGSSIEGTDSAYIPESAQQNYTTGHLSVGPSIKTIGGVYTSMTISGGYWNAPIDVFDQFDTLITSLPVDVGALYTVSGGTPPYTFASEEWSDMDYSAFSDPTIIPAKCIKLAHASASSNYYTTANVSGFFNSASVGFNADNQISSIGGSALAGGGIKVSPNGTLWISGESAESTDSAFIPGVASETFVQSGGSFQIGTTQPLTVAGANKVTIQDGSWFDGTIYVSGNGTLVSSVAHAGADWPQTFSAEAPISIGANGWFDVTSYSAFNVVTSPDQVVQLAHASAVSGTVDLVSSQSANWGGSALALSAGPGVKFDKVGNTLVASTDETVLWNGSGNAFTTTEPLTNFSEIKFHVKSHASANVGEAVVPMVDNNRTAIKLSWADDWNKGAEWLGGLQWWAGLSNTGMTSFVVSNSYYIGLRSGVTFGGGSYGTSIYILDVIGVGRTAEA